MTRSFTRGKIIGLAIALAWVGLPAVGRADDRDLLFAKRQAAPNVLIILDSSGSMNDDFTDSYNYAAWMDDPRSKMQTAKQVLKTVLPGIEATTPINFGFTTYQSGTASGRTIAGQSANGAAAHKQWLYTAGTKTDGSANPWSGSTTDTKGIQSGAPLQFGGLTPFGDATCTDISGVTWANGAPNCPAGQTGFRQFYSNFAYAGTGTVNYLGNATGTNCTGSTATNTCSFLGSASSTWCTYQTSLKNKSGTGTLQTVYDKCRMDLTFVKKTGGTGIGDYGDPQVKVHEVVKHYPCTQISGSGSTCTTYASSATSDPLKTYDIKYNVATDSADPTWDGSFFGGYDPINSSYSLSDVVSADPCSHYQTELIPTTGASESATKPLIPIKTDSNNDDLQETYLDLDSSPNKTRGGVGAFLRRTASVVKFNNSNYSYTINGDLSALSTPLEEITNIEWAYNSTPVAGALNDAYTYFTTDPQFTAAKDPVHACRKNYILLLTDGIETCQSTSSPCTAATKLGALNPPIPVFVIGIGLDSVSGNSLQCIASNSSPNVTNKVYLPQDAAGIADAINKIFNSLSSASRDFSTVAVPSVSTTSDGVAYVSSFNPRNNRSIWAGHIREFILDPISGQIPANVDGKPITTSYSFGTTSPPVAPTGDLVWDAGDTDSTIANVVGDLDSSSGTKRVDPTQVLGASTTWSESVHDQASGVVGRNLFFSLRPGDTGCTSTTYLCLAQLPVGNTGSTPPAPPSTLPNWWAGVRDSSSYANIPGTTPEGGTTANRDQALQNSFSFIRGNRDTVVQTLKISGLFDSTHTTCASLAGHLDSQNDSDSPCYYGENLGDVFHGNPIVVSFPNNLRYFQTQDPKAVNFGAYSDRGASYQTFFSNYRHRRKIIYAGGNDGFLHAIDAGVYNGDATSYTDSSGQTFTPLLNRYDLGSGREIFGYAPRVAVQKFYQLAHTIDQDWTVDGPPLSDDVYIDVTRVGSTPQGIRSSDGCVSPPCSNITGTTPVWRTIVVGGEREGGIPLSSSGGNMTLGGGSVYALDVTDPDKPGEMGAANNGVRGSPECLVNGSASVYVPGASSPPVGCNASFPRILWEFVDNAVPTTNAQTGPTGSPAATNETEKSSGNAESTTQDLGYTWSRPVLGRIKVKDTSANENRDFFVAIFGGGYRNISANQNLSDTNVAGDTGNFLYMVDVETGRVIYKRNLGIWTSGGSGTNTSGNLEAGLPGDPSVIDLNNDGYIDYIYEGDTQGRVWKVDLTTIAPFTSGKIAALDSGNNPVWAPKLFFDEYAGGASGGEARQPIFDRPAVFFLGTTATGQPRLAVAFGTGDRDNMPATTDSNPNWFFVVADDPSFTYPLFKSNLTLANLTANNCTAANTCFNGTGKGFYLKLQTLSGQGAEIVNSNPLVFNNSIFFTTFFKAAAQEDNTTCKVGGSAFTYDVSVSTGVSLLTDIVTGNPIAPSPQGGGAQVASDPIVYQGPNGNLIVISALDSTSIVNLGKAAPPVAKVKSWKEQ